MGAAEGGVRVGSEIPPEERPLNGLGPAEGLTEAEVSREVGGEPGEVGGSGVHDATA
jgi:hypothetical protein